jgi:hypothetical protein
LTERELALFQDFIQPLIGLPVSHVWRGYGSALFLELGKVTPRVRRDETTSPNPYGEWSLGIEWSWRLEGKRRIWCGSWSDEERWLPFLNTLIGTTVSKVELFGRLPEVDVMFSNGLHLLSLMTADGDPEWGFINRGSGHKSVRVRAGRLVFEN